jgi:predicted aspartyl protease
MPIRNFPFTKTRPGDVPRPYLPVTLVNPDLGRCLTVLALIDTGADECALPAAFAKLLGHHLKAGRPRRIATGNGVTLAYAHVIRMEIEGFSTEDVEIDFMLHLRTPLLGVRSFLNNFLLSVDYPKRKFSLRLAG